MSDKHNNHDDDKSRNIDLHPERGLDPHRTFCTRCGGDAEELTLGVIYKAELPTGQLAYTSRSGRTHMARQIHEQLGIHPSDVKWEEVGEGERVPASEPCERCMKEIEEHHKIVADGGVFWKCDECKREGVIRPSDYARAVREAHGGLHNGEPCGIQFASCEEHKTSD